MKELRPKFSFTIDPTQLNFKFLKNFLLKKKLARRRLLIRT